MGPPPPPEPPPPRAPPAGGRVYVLRIWAASPRRPGFRALVRPVASAQWLGFTDASELLAYLLRQSTAPGGTEEP